MDLEGGRRADRDGGGRVDVDQAVLAALAHNHAEGIVVLDDRGVVVFANEAIAATGWSPAALVGRSGFDLLHPGDVERAGRALAAASASSRPAPGVVRVQGPDGTMRDVEVSPGAIELPDGRSFLFATLRDDRLNTAHWDTLSALLSGTSTAASLDLMARRVSNETDGPMAIAFDDRAGRRHVGPLPAVLAGVRPDGTVDDRAGSPFALAATGEVAVVHRPAALPEDLREAAAAFGLGPCVVVPVADPGADHPAFITQWPPSKPMADLLASALVRRPAELVTLALERRHQVERLEWLAWHDQLTGLVNRAGFIDAVAAQAAEGGVLCYLDLDGFKEVNDTHGHVVGDRLLEVCARRFRSASRQQDVVARVGGDEFAVLCGVPLDEDHVAAIGARLVAALAEPVVVAGLSLEVGVTVGIATMSPGCDPDAAISTADRALYEAKRAGKGRWVEATA